MRARISMISVIIVNFQSATLTKRAVESVIGEAELAEVFVVDNTATDEEKNTLRTILPEGVRLIFNKSNEGFARACNKAFTMSKGEWIFLLNPDAYILPGALKKLEDFLVKTPKAGAAGPRIYWDTNKTFLLPPNIFPSPARELYTQLSRLSEKFGLFDSMLYRWRSLKVWETSSPVKQQALSGGHVLLRRSAVEACEGLFDDRFFMYYEDSDLMHRLRKKGYSLFVVPDAEVIHNYTQNKDKTGLMLKSGNIYFNKNFKNSILLAMSGRLSKIKKNAATGNIRDLGKVKKALRLDIPGHFSERWFFEWSPSPLFIPSAGYFGSGPTMEFPAGAWDMLGPGTYFGRVSSRKRLTFTNFKWHWEIE